MGWGGSIGMEQYLVYLILIRQLILYQVNQDRMAYGINCVVSNDTKPGSKIKAVLYKFSANGQMDYSC